MRAFVDTGAWYALFNDLDMHYPRASAFMQKLIGQKAQLFTSYYVIDETLTLIRARLGHSLPYTIGTPSYSNAWSLTGIGIPSFKK
jgi:predicted nucleic acid-binding protein